MARTPRVVKDTPVSTRKTRASASPAKTEPVRASTRKPRAAAPEEEIRVSSRTRKPRAAAPEEEIRVSSRTRKSAVAEAVSELFNPLANIDAQLDSIEKDYSLSGSSLNRDEVRQHTGLLVQDLILGRGLVPGWYTFFGPEQSCKSTGASTLLSASLNSAVPIIAIFDFEGCLVRETPITLNGEQKQLGHLFEGQSWKEGERKYLDGTTFIETAEGEAVIESILYHGEEETTKLTTAGGRELVGFHHPVLVLDEEGNLTMRYLENLKVGDKVVVKRT